MPDGVILLCRVENGMEWIPQFLTHYRRLGVAHMIFLDTGSTDGSVDHLQGSDVTVYRTSLPFKTHRLWMRRWLMDRCPPGTWTLNVDIDELFVLPLFGTTVDLVKYLDENRYTAMRAHMLDLFASGPIGSREAPADAPLEEQYPFYDISDVHPIRDSWIFPDGQSWMGGIRKTIFGRDHPSTSAGLCQGLPVSDFWLTKHPIIKTGQNILAFEDSEHNIVDARVADITGVLLHFKFTPSFRRYVDECVRRGQHWNESEEYKAYQAVLAANPSLSLKQSSAERWSGIDALVRVGFVHAIGSSTMSEIGVSGRAE